MVYRFKNDSIPSALLSDMDGLLLDTERLSKRSFDDVMRAEKVFDCEDIYPQLMGLNKASHLEIFEKILPKKIDPKKFNDDWVARYLSLLEDDVPVKAGVNDFLKEVQKRNIKMAVVTSTKTSKAEDFLTRAGLVDYFEKIIGGDQVTKGKPDPEIYLKGAISLSVPVSDCLALEDSNNGVMAAYDSGAKVIQIPDLAPKSQKISALKIPTLDSISAVPNFLGW